MTQKPTVWNARETTIYDIYGQLQTAYYVFDAAGSDRTYLVRLNTDNTILRASNITPGRKQRSIDPKGARAKELLNAILYRRMT